MKTLYTTKEAAEVMGYTDDAYIRRLILAGKLYARRVGQGWLVPGYAIDWFKKGKKLIVMEGGLLEDDLGGWHYFFNLEGNERARMYGPATSAVHAEEGLQIHVQATQEQWGDEYKVIFKRVRQNT